jgi:hypothetical protein
MARQSIYSIEERIVMSTWVHERLNTEKKIHVLRDDFQTRFNKVGSPKMTMLRWERKLFSTGSVKDRPRSGWLSKRHEKCADVAASLLRSPKKSLRKRSSELGIPEASMLRHIKTDVGFKAFRPTFVNELSDNDMQKWQDACARFLKVFTTIPKRGDVIFTDEYAIYRNSRSRNVYLWSK